MQPKLLCPRRNRFAPTINEHKAESSRLKACSVDMDWIKIAAISKNNAKNDKPNMRICQGF